MEWSTTARQLALAGIVGSFAVQAAAQDVANGAAPPPSADKPSNLQQSLLEEIVVTATKRPELVRRISASVSAVTGDQLQALGAQSFADYLTRMPGVVFNATLPGFSTVTLRGIATTPIPGTGQGTTGYFINEVPLTDPYFSAGVPDIDGFDVDNVTVLRGPQGTLFGSASLGGAINYQAARPNLSRISAAGVATLSDTSGGGMGGAVKAMVNVPVITDRLAIRGVYVYREDAGFIDNLKTGKDNSNRTITSGGRVLVTWKPVDRLTFNYLFLQQRQRIEDAGFEQTVLGRYKKSTIPEPATFTTTIHNIRADYDLGPATLTATASSHKKHVNSITDRTAQFAPALSNRVSPFTVSELRDGDGKTYEARIASAAGEDRRLDYVFGIMQDDSRVDNNTHVTGVGVTQAVEALYAGRFGVGVGQRVAADDVYNVGDVHFRGIEKAAYGEATWHFSPQFKATLGGRLFNTKMITDSDQHGFLQLLTSGLPQIIVRDVQKESGFSPKASITFTPTRDHMFYALVSKGFRYGGSNVNPPDPTFPTPRTFSSDSIINYEVGARTNWLAKRLQIDGTLFYVDWKDIALSLATPRAFRYTDNAGTARSYGFEGAVRFVPAPGLTVATNLTYLNAKLSKTFIAGGRDRPILKGTTLPGASKWQIAPTVSYEYAGSPLRPSLTVSGRYISKAPGEFNSNLVEGGYTLVDAIAALHFEHFTASAFMQNIGNSHGVATVVVFPGGPKRYVVRPRTTGITLSARL